MHFVSFWYFILYDGNLLQWTPICFCVIMTKHCVYIQTHFCCTFLWHCMFLFISETSLRSNICFLKIQFILLICRHGRRDCCIIQLVNLLYTTWMLCKKFRVWCILSHIYWLINFKKLCNFFNGFYIWLEMCCTINMLLSMVKQICVVQTTKI